MYKSEGGKRGAGVGTRGVIVEIVAPFLVQISGANVAFHGKCSISNKSNGLGNDASLMARHIEVLPLVELLPKLNFELFVCVFSLFLSECAQLRTFNDI